MNDDELVTHEQVARWLPQDVRFAIDPHEHEWVEVEVAERAKGWRICTVPGCDATEETA